MRRAAYGPDLAFVHDAGYSDFARGAAPGLLALLRRAGISRGFVVELGCGSGAATRALVAAGHRVLGLDASPHMVRCKITPRARRDRPVASAQRPQAARREPYGAAAHQLGRSLVQVEQVDLVARGGPRPEEVGGRADRQEVQASPRHHATRVASVDRQPVAAVEAKIVVEGLPGAGECDPPVPEALHRRGAGAAAGVLGDLGKVAAHEIVGEDLWDARVGAAAREVGVALERQDAPPVAHRRVAARTVAGGDRVAAGGVRRREPDLRDTGVDSRGRIARRIERDRGAAPAERRIAARPLTAAQLDEAAAGVAQVDLNVPEAPGPGEVAGRLEGEEVAEVVQGRIGARAGRVMGRLKERPAGPYEDLPPRVAARQGIAVGVESDRTRGHHGVGVVAARADRRHGLGVVEKTKAVDGRARARSDEGEGVVEGGNARQAGVPRPRDADDGWRPRVMGGRRRRGSQKADECGGSSHGRWSRPRPGLEVGDPRHARRMPARTAWVCTGRRAGLHVNARPRWAGAAVRLRAATSPQKR
ncbi:MAG: class I SAM-dependent methyltransferase [Deltaproteobacteria bacterium]|nr:MAG: class I SAM-dependent methyltransferase [Deltaproteobacteria bacterium]